MSSDRPEPALFAEIAESTALISSYVRDHTPASFHADRMCRDAIAMRLIVIGEAANRLPRETWATMPQLDWQGMANLRHLLAHDYGAASPSILWTIATVDVPQLASTIEPLAGI